MENLSRFCVKITIFGLTKFDAIMKRFSIFLILLLSIGRASADEGMWMIQRLEKIYPTMQKMGIELPLDAIYNPQRSAISDAVVAIDGGVGTGSMISDEGLMITNHHVAYSDICALSTAENNYLETGFWARSRDEEIPVVGKTVSFLRRVVDVTEECQALRAKMQKEGPWGVMSMRRLVADIEKRHAEKGFEVACHSMWHGRKFYLYVYEVFRDVRLVGAPPVTIGAFGGDVDNWSWPQHKGDFTLYRVYADREGRPADYSEENLPLKPRKVLKVSLEGVTEGDFTMVVGYPGRTNRYASSFEITERKEVKNPIVVENRHLRMDVIRREMNADARTRRLYSDQFFSLSNFADLARWENLCLQKYDVEAIRRAEEERMAEALPEGRAVVDKLRCGFEARREAERHLNYLREMWLGPSEAVLVANRVNSHIAKMQRTGRDTLYVNARDAEGVLRAGDRLREGYVAKVDREIMSRLLARFVESVPREKWGVALVEMVDKSAGDVEKMAREAFDASFCSDADRFEEYFSQDRSVAELLADPLVRMASSVKTQTFTGDVTRAEHHSCGMVSLCKRGYEDAMYRFRESQGQAQYPDANSTMRLSYGRVADLTPRDGVHYLAQSTAKGYLEKFDPKRYEFRVDDRLRNLILRQDWGRWAEDGVMRVNFLTNNDITGGNSGSPVLDRAGRLIGLAFDGNRESMACDVYFQPEFSRTVCVDIRFVLWVIDRYAQSEGLVREILGE